jgi:YVTN family beta-propeller protein
MHDLSSAGPSSGLAVASPSEPPGRPGAVEPELGWLRALGWREFEELIGRAYQFQGYEVLSTAHGADGGIDLILTRGTERIFVQCKHWNTNQVGVKIVRELFGVVAAHGATWGIVATSGNFTEEAEEFARQARITLLNGPAVAQLIALGQASEPTDGPPSNQSSPVPAPRISNVEPSCPICSAPMALRTARRGPQAGSRFWGCSRFPGCKGVRPAPQTAAPAERKRPRRSSNRLAATLVGLPLAGLVAVGGVMLGASTIVSTVSHLGSPLTQPIAGPVGAFGEQTMDITYDSAANLIYTANYVSGNVTVADAKTLTPQRTIDVAGKPIAVASDAKHHHLYVADGGAKKIYVVDTRTNRTVATLATTAKPSDLAVDVSRQRLFVVSKAGNRLEVFNTASRARVATKTVPGGASAVAVNEASHQVFISGVTITVYNGYSLARTSSPPILSNADGLAVDSRTDRVYLVHNRSIEEYNLVTHKRRLISAPADGAGIAVDPGKRQAYLAVPGQNSVDTISLK